MRQGRITVPLVCALLLGAPAIGAIPVHAATSKSATAQARPSKALRQFTGWVTAYDRTSITVEKRGKTPRTMTFVRDPEMSTTGEIEKDARVTVYYRDEGGRATAHRVVAKSASANAGR